MHLKSVILNPRHDARYMPSCLRHRSTECHALTKHIPKSLSQLSTVAERCSSCPVTTKHAWILPMERALACGYLGSTMEVQPDRIVPSIMKSPVGVLFAGCIAFHDRRIYEIHLSAIRRNSSEPCGFLGAFEFPACIRPSLICGCTPRKAECCRARFRFSQFQIGFLRPDI